MFGLGPDLADFYAELAQLRDIPALRQLRHLVNDVLRKTPTCRGSGQVSHRGSGQVTRLRAGQPGQVHQLVYAALKETPTCRGSGQVTRGQGWLPGV